MNKYAVVILLLAFLPLSAQKQVFGIDVKAGTVVDLSKASVVKLKSVAVAPAGACTELGASQVYQATGVSEQWLCTPTTGTACPCQWVRSSGGGGGSGGGGSAVERSISVTPASTAWYIPVSQHLYTSCDLIVYAKINGSIAEPSAIVCNPLGSTLTVAGQPLGQYDVLVLWPSAQEGSVLFQGGMGTTGYQFSGQQYWTVSAATHGLGSCDMTIKAYIGNVAAEPDLTYCNTSSTPATINGQTIGQYGVLVSWPSAQSGRVVLSN